MQKSSRFPFLASVLVVVLIGAAVGAYALYSLPRSCEVNAVQEASAILVIQMKWYDDVYQVATSASQTSLDPPVLTLQQILMDTQEVSVPACLQTAKNELINYMGTVIRAFRAYAAWDANATVKGLINQSEKHFSNFRTELESVNKCAPYCIP